MSYLKILLFFTQNLVVDKVGHRHVRNRDKDEKTAIFK